VYCLVGGALELSCCLSYGFLLVSILVSLADVRQDLLFHACQFYPFQSTHCKEFQSKKDYVLIVRGFVFVIGSPRQCVLFAHGTSGTVVEQEVKPSQMQRPMGLTMVKFLGRHEILEVLVVGPDFYWIGRSFQEVPPVKGPLTHHSGARSSPPERPRSRSNITT